jgi:TRAP-type C4-dicarboxylate transport system substrate-binding protein
MLPTILWPDTAEGTLAASNALMTLYEEFPEIQAEFKDVKIMWFSMLAAYHVISKKSVRVPSDLNGMKIGAGGMMAELVKRQGGGQVGIVPPKSYMSLKTGVVDGMFMAWSAMGVYKLWEIASYVNEITVGRISLPVLMNKKTWNSLSPDLQNLMMELIPKQLEKGVNDLYGNVEKQKKAMIANGAKVFVPKGNDYKAWTDAFEPLEAEWLTRRKSDGYPVAEKILARYKELAEAAWK